VVKTEQELRNDIERYAERENWSAWLIVSALIMEAYAGWYFSTPDKPWYETTFLIAANLLIAAGVYGEIRFGRKADTVGKALQQISDEKIAELKRQAAEATQRAARAELELEKIRTPRKLTGAVQQAEITNQLKPFIGTNFDSAIVPYDPEAADLLLEIETALKNAGWTLIPWISPDDLIFDRTQSGRPNAGIVSATGVFVAADPNGDRALWNASRALASALNSVNIAALAGPIPPTVKSTNAHAIHLLVGAKPR
jgi:hypothetical protein